MMGETVAVGAATVQNVLVEPGLSQDVKDVKDIRVPVGARVDYTLRFPTGAEPPAHDAKVTVRGTVLDVLNVPDHWRPQDVFGEWTNPWDMTVLVGRTLGDFAQQVSVVAVAAAVDALGDPVVSESTVYNGMAQARMKSGSESPGDSSLTDAAETWWFVVPWQSGFASLRPQSTRILCGAVGYDVVSIENVDGKGEYASFKALRRNDRAETGETGETGITGA